jgi:hypothetical protein
MGHVSRIRYVPDGSTPLDTGADLTITEDATGAAILIAANIGTTAVEWNPRPPTHAQGDGAALLYAGAGQPVGSANGAPVFQSRIKVVVAQGGNTKLGTLYVWLD